MAEASVEKAQTKPEREGEGMRVDSRPTGIIDAPFEDPENMPIRPPGAAGMEGTLKVFAAFQQGLADQDGFSHAIRRSHFHRSRSFDLRVVILTLALLAARPTGAADAVPTVQTRVHPLCPVTVSLRSSGDPTPGARPRLRYALTVTSKSKKHVRFIELAAYVFSSAGEFRGYHGFFEEVDLPPGGTVELNRESEPVVLEPDDRVILTVMSLRGPTLLSPLWVLPVCSRDAILAKEARAGGP